ncbi:MAG: enoyl-CoA hydratase/isomerase family protein [Alicyclobacillus sp.]|nr:enoyl-CoA hydratase/isomerase family protein [Alicyclobacillus sp.]
MSTNSNSHAPEPAGTTSAPDSQGTVHLERQGAVALLTLSNPKALNAMTWHMYEALTAHLDALAADGAVRVVVLRGDGERAFAAGTDIKQFVGFTGKDGVQYEQRIDHVTRKLLEFPKPTIAAVHGYAIGGGLILAAACDLRYATPQARFGAPIARTLGNCLSIRNYSRVASLIGEARLKELIFTARQLRAEEALAAGFVSAVYDADGFFEKVLEIAEEIASRAPLTLWATKVALSRLREVQQPLPEFSDVIERVYGSADFQEGVQAHLEKRPAEWRGC